MNVLSFLTPKSDKPTSKADQRYRQYEHSGNGKVTVRLPPARGDELRVRMSEVEKARDAAVNAAAEKRADALKALRADYETRRAAIEAENRNAVAVANNDYDTAEDKLLAEYAAPLSPEQIALLTTPIGSVVRVPEKVAS